MLNFLYNCYTMSGLLFHLQLFLLQMYRNLQFFKQAEQMKENFKILRNFDNMSVRFLIPIDYKTHSSVERRKPRAVRKRRKQA